jgi:molecular chaperone GrpE (heat shock protein)
MKKWLDKIFHPQQKLAGGGDGSAAPVGETALETAGGGLLELQKETQLLRIELETREQSIAALKQEIERLRLRQEQMIAETVAARLGGLFNDLAGPASQILTQADLLERQDRPVQARDVLAVARRMVRALERYGISFDGQAGQQVAYDPNRHAPITSGAAPTSGQMVTIRFAGVMYQGKTIYKAMVE